MANYDIERHVYLMQKQNRLVKMNQHLENVNKIEWIEYQMYYRMVTSQLWFNDKEIYVQSGKKPKNQQYVIKQAKKVFPKNQK